MFNLILLSIVVIANGVGLFLYHMVQFPDSSDTSVNQEGWKRHSMQKCVSYTFFKDGKRYKILYYNIFSRIKWFDVSWVKYDSYVGLFNWVIIFSE